MSGPYPPIGDYALLADCFSSALVSRHCSIDWACLRRFDSGSAFGRLLDWERGGFFAISPPDGAEVTRRYLHGSLVLETEIRCGQTRARIYDAFAMRKGGRSAPQHRLIRIVEGREGHLPFDVRLEPRFDYGQMRPWLRRHDSGALSVVGGDDALVVTSNAPLDLEQDAYRLVGRFDVSGGQRVRFCVEVQPPHLLDPTPVADDDLDELLTGTIDWWGNWSSRTVAEGPYAEHIRLSASALKGLTCAPTGAIVAAPTTSLPEQIGGQNNWDYRYSWVRDSTLTLEALARAGHPEVARGFRDFLLRSAAGHVEDLQLMYGCYGEHRLTERELDLDGYRKSRPVRVGNAAADQRQHDVYGHILDAAELWARGEEEVDHDEWRFLRQIVDAAADRWREPGHGLWEMRTKPRHHTHSKVLMWVALDRGIRLAHKTGHADEGRERWQAVRDDIREAVEKRGVAEQGWFRQCFDEGDTVDASLLRLPMLGFVDARDERMRRTVERIQDRLSVGRRGFLRRYEQAEGQEGVFLLCSFWLVEVLVMQGRHSEGTELFEALLEAANDVGLFAEQYDPDTGELLGNFPQAFTHMALINAAERLGGGKPRGRDR